MIVGRNMKRVNPRPCRVINNLINIKLFKNDPAEPQFARVKSAVRPQVSHDYVKTGGEECGPAIWISVRSLSPGRIFTR